MSIHLTVTEKMMSTVYGWTTDGRWAGGRTYVRYIVQLCVCATFFARRCATIEGVLTNDTLCGFLSMTCAVISQWFVGLFLHDICNH